MGSVRCARTATSRVVSIDTASRHLRPIGFGLVVATDAGGLAATLALCAWDTRGIIAGSGGNGTGFDVAHVAASRGTPWTGSSCDSSNPMDDSGGPAKLSESLTRATSPAPAGASGESTGSELGALFLLNTPPIASASAVRVAPSTGMNACPFDTCTRNAAVASRRESSRAPTRFVSNHNALRASRRNRCMCSHKSSSLSRHAANSLSSGGKASERR